jgi:hypothetical protein
MLGVKLTVGSYVDAALSIPSAPDAGTVLCSQFENSHANAGLFWQTAQ